MIEKKLNILSEEVLENADAICFTSNGIVKSNNELIMGAGVAKAFKNKFPLLPKRFGRLVKEYGNKCYYLQSMVEFKRPSPKDWRLIWIVSFPTKNHWKDKSDINLIIKSCTDLMGSVEKMGWKKVYLPFPGCSNGGLDKSFVRKHIEKLLDDRITAVHL